MKKLLSMVALAAAVALSGSAMATDVEAGPIWNNADAEAKCPKVCSSLKWNKAWKTTEEGKMSTCGTTANVNIPVGPIWNDKDAEKRCPALLAKVKWNKQWKTTVQGKMSVCGCTLNGE